MHDFRLSAPLGNRRHAGHLLHFLSGFYPIAIASHGGQQPGGHGVTGPRKRGKDLSILMGLHQRRELGIVLFDGMVECDDLRDQRVDDENAAVDNGWVCGQRASLTDFLQPLIDEALTITQLLALVLSPTLALILPASSCCCGLA